MILFFPTLNFFQGYLHAPEVSGPEMLLTYVSGILNIRQYHWLVVKI
jgi:hypothetical protein